MSALVARIMLTIFMLPCAALLYFVSALSTEYFIRNFTSSYQLRETLPLAIGAIVFCGGIATYWTLLWRKSVRWTPQRLFRTRLATWSSVGIGIVVGVILAQVVLEMGIFFGSVVAPLTWLILTTLAWRETPDERSERAAGTGGVACPNCGYNLTGLRGTRCPECGQEFTLDALLAAQQTGAPADLA